MTAPLTKCHVNSGNRPVGFVARRIVMLASAATVGACVMVISADTISNRWTSAAYAQTVQPRSGFADIVDKIKPAVISIRATLMPGRVQPAGAHRRRPRKIHWSASSANSGCRTIIPRP